MSFAHPHLAAAAAVSFAFVCAVQFYPGRAAIVHPNLDFAMQTIGARVWRQLFMAMLDAAAIALLVLASANPTQVAFVPKATVIAVCLDTSGSMMARDVPPTRAAAAASAIRTFISAAPPETAFGIVTFAGAAHSLIGPTTNRAALDLAIDTVPAPNGQTAIGDAILLADAMMPRAGPRAIIMLTDGKNNHGTDPTNALRILGAAHVAVEIVHIRHGADPREDMARLVPALTMRRTQRDLAAPLAYAGLVLLAAAWLARGRGAFGL